MSIETQTAIIPVEVTIKLAGRGKRSITVPQIGQVDSTGKLNTDKFKGFPLMDLVSFAQRAGLDASQALVDGINVELRRAKKATVPPPASKILETRGLVSNEQDARIGAMHLAKVGKILNMTAEDMVNALENYRATHPSEN